MAGPSFKIHWTVTSYSYVQKKKNQEISLVSFLASNSSPRNSQLRGSVPTRILWNWRRAGSVKKATPLSWWRHVWYKCRFKQSLNLRVLKHQHILGLSTMFWQLIFLLALHWGFEAPLSRPLKSHMAGVAVFLCSPPPWILCLHSPSRSLL